MMHFFREHLCIFFFFKISIFNGGGELFANNYVFNTFFWWFKCYFPFLEYLKGVKEDGVCVVYDLNMVIKFTDDGIISVKK